MLMIQRLLGLVLGLAFLVLVFVFMSFLVALALSAALLAGAAMWWRGRAGRRAVIEGEYRIIKSP